MVPWPNRADPFNRPPPPTEPPPPPPRAPPQPAPTSIPPRRHVPSAGPAARKRVPVPSRLNDSDLFDASAFEPFEAERVSSESDQHHLGPPTRPASHARSMSHPFPSLFSAKKKPPAKDHALADFETESDDSDSPVPITRMAKQKGDFQSAGPRRANTAGSQDFATGNCMTCGSLVRWPRELKVFKCTICLTVNDLQPIPGTKRSGNVGGLGPGSQAPGQSAEPASSPPSCAPISFEHTKNLVRHCLRTFLYTSFLREGNSSGDRTGRRHRANPSVSSLGTRNEGLWLPNPTQSQPEMKNESAISFSSFEQDRSGNLTPAQPNASVQGNGMLRSYSTSYSETRPDLRGLDPNLNAPNAGRIDPESRRLFKPLEDYVASCFSSFQCLNSSFVPRNLVNSNRRCLEPPRGRAPQPRREAVGDGSSIAEVDAKLLLLGDFAENGAWWTGRREEAPPSRSASRKGDEYSIVTSRSPSIDWPEVDAWYDAVVNSGRWWMDTYNEITQDSSFATPSDHKLQQVEEQIIEAQEHTQRVLLKATETLLKRPGRPITHAEDLRFLLIILANPLLHASSKTYAGYFSHTQQRKLASRCDNDQPRSSLSVSGRHSVIIKRVLGLLSHTRSESHGHLISWFSRFPDHRFIQFKELVGSFLVYRLIRQHEKKHEAEVDLTYGLIPQLNAGRSPASLHDALGQPSRSSKKTKDKPSKMVYSGDWQIKAATRVMGLLFVANNATHHRRYNAAPQASGQDEVWSSGGRDQVQARGQIIPTSDFYTTLLDDADLVSDFEAWQQKKGKFSFCQYPFLLSIGAKIQILEHDARRQMQSKARDAFFDSIMTRRNIDSHLTLNVRRDCLVEDSLKGVSEVIGGGGEDIKKGLRIVFHGEEGVDAGGLRKEWFLLLVREVFNPEHGMFVYDEDSQHCYFNPNSFETSDQFFLVGCVLGLAIYNSTILDVDLPPFAFRKLLAAAPAPTAGLSIPRPVMAYTLDDLTEYRPRLARGLRQLLEYDGDVESTFCLDFVVDVEKYGSIERVSLCPGGERRMVTNANRREYVDLYVRYLLDTAVTRQFEPFKRGFFTVCGGNALSLFRPEEIELLVRGSDEPLDINALRIVAEYDNWGSNNPVDTEPTLMWFWDSFKRASPKDQRKLLAFITGSDRIPAMGAASLTIKVSCHGDDVGRYPTARTCFNTLALCRYRSRGRLEKMLWDAVHESEGFGLK